MTNPSNADVDGNKETNSQSLRDCENDYPRIESGNYEEVRYRLANERNRLRWEYEEKYEKAEIEKYINEDIAVRERNSISQAVKLSEIVLNIQQALHAGIEHDVPKALENLERLVKEPFTTLSLLYAPCIVRTVYLCCRYEKSEEIRALAKKCYVRFQPCVGVPDGATFETAFQNEVREFWEKQNTIVYDSEKYDWKQFTMDDTSVEISNGIKTENDEEVKLELKSDKNETKVKIETIEVKSETNDDDTIKKEANELLDNKSIVKEDIPLKMESVDDKSVVKQEISKVKDGCKTDTENLPFDSKVAIKQEVMDTDDIEVTYCNILKSENKFALSELSIKLEPFDADENFKAEYDSDKDCYIIN